MTHTPSQHHTNQAGFTLVELSIVLVIIGLIVSGILIGGDMIRAAEIRSTISQIESYNTAVNTFRDKYNGIPGDISTNRAAQFGFIARTGVEGIGDGDRFVEGCADMATEFGCETAAFWVDLSRAGMIAGDYSALVDIGTTATPGATAGELNQYLPEAELGQGHYVTVFPADGNNFFQITQISTITASTGVYALRTGMTPQTAFNIDDKLDDSNPFRGTVQAVHGAVNLNDVTNINPPAGTPGNLPLATAALPTDHTACAGILTTVTPNISSYNTVTDSFADNPACQIRIQAGF